MPFDDERAARHADPVLGEFFGGTTSPSQDRIDWLVKRHGLPGKVLGRDADGGGMVIGTAEVVFDGALTFEFAGAHERREVTSALVFVARDRDGNPLDLVAWAPRIDRTASRFGRASVLGEQSLHGFRLGSNLPTIHRGVLSWLRAGRDGVVIVNPARAARALLDSPGRLAVEDEAHAAEIAKLLCSSIDLSRIVVPTRKAVAA